MMERTGNQVNDILLRVGKESKKVSLNFEYSKEGFVIEVV